MRKLILEKKTGFYTSLPFNIYELSGNLFYSDTFTEKISKGEDLEFNVPAGVYNYDGSFIKLDSPVKVANIALPMKERNLTVSKYEIVFGVNKNKCTIFYDDKIILFDNQFKTEPSYKKYCIYFHELGHHFYSTEQKADLYSIKKLLDYGFNPSQIVLSFFESLSEKSFERKLAVINELTKNLG